MVRMVHIQRMIMQDMKKISRFSSKVLLLIFGICYLSVLYAQEGTMLSIKSGDLVLYVDPHRGNFSILDTAQGELNFMSWLFGGSQSPSSYIQIYIDKVSYTLDQMEIVNPLGVSLGSQIDGIFQVDGVQVEVAIFAMNISEEFNLNTIGIAVKMSNTSEQPKQAGVKVLLDSDIGEPSNNPLLYLPAGNQITAGMIATSNHIPPYIFIGQKQGAVLPPKGKGFYLYPNVGDQHPSKMAIGNWRYIDHNLWYSNFNSPFFTYANDGTKDAGVTLRYGMYSLIPSQEKSFGLALSKHYSPLWPVIEQEALDKGIFNDNRFQVEEILKNKGTLKIDDVQRNTLQSASEQQRELFRLRQLGVVSTNSSKDLKPVVLRALQDNRKIWSYLYQLNSQMDIYDDNVEQVLERDFIEESFDTPPSQGIISE